MRTQRAFNALRVLAGILLVVSIFAPLYLVPISLGGAVQPTHTWDLVRGDAGSAGLLAAAFWGPAAVFALCGCRLSRAWSILLLATELVLLGMSVAIFLALADTAYTLLPLLGPWLVVPASASIGAGIWLALAADGVLLVLCLAQAGSQLRAPLPSPR